MAAIVKELQNQKWRSALIGYVIGGNPSFKDMLKFVYGVWNTVTTPQVYLHDEGYFIFRFDDEEDKLKIMQNGPYTYNNRPMILKQWVPYFKLAEEPLNAIPVWIVFPNLPIQYWAIENLGRIASCLGKPICTDKLTAKEERISYARILIEMDVAQPLLESVTLEEPDGSCILQSIEYEWKPEYCQECLQIGINDQQQPRRQQKKAKQQQWKAKPSAGPPAEAAEKANEGPKENHKVVNLMEESQEIQRCNNRDKQKME
ncbi:PREDICTED: uncharacterized protein LOC109216415 [Nicotiana attenuata]|uniref:uncharacterized protein LOC109216415 n=1 Tax=Nicotiana attenuata TaxID=49451 RepID=UPI00090496E3|nr:PREDICTED: uncharacterized protein LOC109216415 [Nicotiana attenuata]